MNRLTMVLMVLFNTLFTVMKSSATTPVGSELLGGESIHRVTLVDPLGETGFHFGVKVQFQRLEIDTTTFDLHLSMAYGILPGFDFSFYLPYMRMTKGAYSKYGTGDAVFSLKYIRTKPPLRPYNWGFQGYILMPSGYREEIYGFPAFSGESMGYGGRLLFQLDGQKVSLTANIGSSFTEKGPGFRLFYGGGVRVNLLGKLIMAAGEFTGQKPHDRGDADYFAFAGAESHLPYIGIGLKLGVESELKVNSDLRLIAGVTLTSRKTLPGVSKGILETKRYYKNIMVFDFLDEEENFVGDDVEGRFTRKLGSLDEITILEPSAKIPFEEAVKNREKALSAVEGVSADLLVFGKYHSFGYERKSDFGLPYLISYPRTEAYISADVWVIDTKSREQVFTARITGRASGFRRIAFLSSPGDNQQSFLNTVQKEKLRKAAVDDFIRNLSARFSHQLNK